MAKVLILTIFAAFIFVFSYYIARQNNQPIKVASQMREATPVFKYSNTKDIGKEENIVKNSQPITPEQPDPMPEQMLIQEVTAPQKPHSFYTQSANSRFVRLNNEYINNLEKDDVFEITIPQTGITYPVLIHKKEQITEQDTLLEGRMSGYDENSSIQITYSPTHTFIVLNTPEGNYSIDAMGDLGIVRPASDYRYKEVQPLVSQVKAAPEPE